MRARISEEFSLISISTVLSITYLPPNVNIPYLRLPVNDINKSFIPNIETQSLSCTTAVLTDAKPRFTW